MFEENFKDEYIPRSEPVKKSEEAETNYKKMGQRMGPLLEVYRILLDLKGWPTDNYENDVTTESQKEKSPGAVLEKLETELKALLDDPELDEKTIADFKKYAVEEMRKAGLIRPNPKAINKLS